MSKVKLDDLTPEQKEQLASEYAKKQKAEQAELDKKKLTYERKKGTRAKKIERGVLSIEKKISDFKTLVSDLMAEQHTELDEFGKISKKSKGGFHIVTPDGNFKITRTRDTDPKWDETAHKGVGLIKTFLTEDIAEKDAKPGILTLLMELIEKNQAGELEFSKVMTFLKHEDAFDHPKWIEGLRLIKQGYKSEFKKFGYTFHKKNAEGKWEKIIVNFSNL